MTDTGASSSHPMERVLSNLHQQLCIFLLQKTTPRFRSLLEQFALLTATGIFAALWLVHRYCVANVSECLTKMEGFHYASDLSHVVLVGPDETSIASTTSLGSSVTSSSMQCIGNSITMSFSKYQGYLLLAPEQLVNLTVQCISVSKSDVNCFGEPFVQKIIRGVGKEAILRNWFRSVYQDGYVYQPSSQRLSELIPPNDSPLGKISVVIKTCFLFFITTTLVSFTLRETQERMLGFTRQLQARVRSRRPVGSLVITHLVDNLVFIPVMLGAIFFLNEFYKGDKILALLVLSLVWICEVYSISLRSHQGIHYFPRVFFLLFCLFHFYLFSFPIGFGYLALMATVCCIFHSMLFFWHRYELPLAVRPIARPLPRAPSEATNLSRATSAQTSGGQSALFQEDESYMMFMDGEVVMHRNRQPLQPPRIPDQVLADVGVGPSEENDDNELMEGAEDQTPTLGVIYGTPRINNLSTTPTSEQVRRAPRVPTLS